MSQENNDNKTLKGISSFKVELITQEADIHGEGGYIVPNGVYKVLLYLKNYGKSSEKEIYDMALYSEVHNKVSYEKMLKYGTISVLDGKYEITKKGLEEVNSIKTEVL